MRHVLLSADCRPSVYLVPDTSPEYVETLDNAWYHIKNKKPVYENVPERYQNCEWFNF